MQKAVSIILLMSILHLLCGHALALQEATVTQENCYALPEARRCYYFARIDNTGNEPIKLDTLQLELLDADGEVIESSDEVIASPNTLNPGEYAYIRLTLYTSNVLSAVADCLLTFEVSEPSKYLRDVVRLDSQASFDPDDTHSEYRVGRAVVTAVDSSNHTFNRSNDTLSSIVAVCAMLDEAGNILYVGTTSSYGMDIGELRAGDELKLEVPVDTELMAIIVPERIDSIVYSEVYEFRD